ncbi:LlaJI family restriction endonuclease [Mycoplasma cottewii]|uniref:LlaJI family restriction endonuclease n=1 Tax=Mycoplasma cottewii TaxID=51364 RepID=A0ABY5TZT8_9MOLU|nr:LlaJI family restriction endonuclease [Mycoplasma cottewii]UWD35076.1 LlaJI family restriction endonuclease [Mycoplasma cottewii]
MIIVKNILLFIYPKYIKNIEKDSQNNYKKFKQIINVIKKYKKSKQRKIHTTNNYDLESSNMLSICLELLLDYFEHGLYNNHKQIIELNGEGEIFWEKTINENTAYISNNIPVYLDTFNFNQKDNDNDYFRQLHSFVLTDISNRFSEVLELIGLEGVDLSLSDISNFGKTEYIVHRLNQEISTQFITYKQNILKLLKKYIQEKESEATSHSVSFFGTNAFNLVWEDVCSVVMNNSRDKTLKELNLSNFKDDNSKSLKNIIFKPKWKYHPDDNHQNDHHHKSEDTLNPDIICIDENSLFIYDAKYYNIVLNENVIKDKPGIADITKQYLYELAYKEFAKEYNLNIVENAFLFPSDENHDIKQEKIGCVTIDVLS